MSTPSEPSGVPGPDAGGDGPVFPGYGQPVYGQPVYGQPAYGQPSYGQPSYPQPGEARPALAGWGPRAGGLLIDGLISGAAQLLAGQVSYALGQLVTLVIFLVFAYLVGTTGQTPGMQVARVRLLRESDGGPLGVGVALGRAVLHVLDWLPLGLGFLWPIWDERKQTFADKIVHSVAIRV